MCVILWIIFVHHVYICCESLNQIVSNYNLNLYFMCSMNYARPVSSANIFESVLINHITIPKNFWFKKHARKKWRLYWYFTEFRKYFWKFFELFLPIVCGNMSSTFFVVHILYITWTWNILFVSCCFQSFTQKYVAHIS